MGAISAEDMAPAIVRPVWAITSRWKSDHNPERREYVGEDKGVRRKRVEAPQQWKQGVDKPNEESEESFNQICNPNESDPS